MQRMTAAWRDPVVAGRLLRGIRLNLLTDAPIQRARKMMQDNWQNPAFRDVMKRRPRPFTADQIRAIRADPRSAKIVGHEYGVSHQNISKIRAKVSYADID